MTRDDNLGIWLRGVLFVLAIGLIGGLSGCIDRAQGEEDGKIQVLATTSIVADVVRQVGGDVIELDVILPVGIDPHTFTLTPQDMTKISRANLLFMNGLGLETFLEPYLEDLGDSVIIVEVSEGGKMLEPSHGDEHGSVDPHIWTDPGNVMVWVDNISSALTELDPDHAKLYLENAQTYQLQLQELDAWILSQVALIPQEQRKIVADHEALAYFSHKYGFTQIGTVIPGTSTLSEPSAQDIAALEDLIRDEKINAIFVDTTANSMLSERISRDTDVEIVRIYIGSLTEPGGEAGSYLDYMHYNVTAIVEALK